jgi:hypothetical protein
MRLDRRSFMKRLGGGLLAIAAAPLVVPSRAPVFIPSDRLEMGVPRPIATAPLEWEEIRAEIEEAAAAQFDGVLRPALSAAPTAYFVSGDTELPTMTWQNVFMQAEDMSLILPLPVTVSSSLTPADVLEQILEASEKKYGIRAVAWDRGWRT